MQQSFLVHVIESRTNELLHIIKDEIDHYQLRPFMITGMVLTGGGSLLSGIDYATTKLLKMPARIGMPHDRGINAKYLNSPIYATGYGLLLYAANKYGRGMQHLQGPAVKKIFYRMKSWVSEFF